MVERPDFAPSLPAVSTRNLTLTLTLTLTLALTVTLTLEP